MSSLETQIAEGLMSLASDARAAVEAEIRTTIRASSPGEILTFVTERGEKFPPAVSKDYVSRLWEFATQSGSGADSAITERIVAATQRSLSGFLSSEATQEALANVLRDIGKSGDEAVRSNIREQVQFVRNEAAAGVLVTPGAQMAELVAGAAMDQASAILQTAAGKAILIAIGKAMATTAGKVVVVRLLQASVAKVLASAAIKSFVVAIIKKIGITALVKVTLAKILVVAIPALAVVHIPIFWIVAPLIGAFLLYEMNHLPDKLANKLPGEVGAKVEEEWPAISREIASSILLEAARRATENKGYVD